MSEDPGIDSHLEIADISYLSLLQSHAGTLQAFAGCPDVQFDKTFATDSTKGEEMIASNATPVRSVKSWAPVAAAMRRWQESSAGLRHVGTTVSERPVDGVLSSGQVLWATDMDDSKVGLAWGWARLRGEVVVMTDPMAVATNLALVDDDSGEPLSASQVMCCLNSVIYSLPWQENVMSTI